MRHRDLRPSLVRDHRSASVLAAPPYQLEAARHGTMLVNPHDFYMGQALLQYGECSELELAMLLQLVRVPGLVVEVGANMGIHTVPLAAELARHGRTMLALEPQPVIFQQLCANLALNGLMNVTALPYACGRTGGMVQFPVPDYRREGNFGGISKEAEVRPGIRYEQVPCIRLDDLVGGQLVGLLKIDVEGFELQVLEGSADTLARSRPLLYVENDRPDQSPQLIEWLWAQNYALWWHIPPLFNPRNHHGKVENLYENVCSFNMLGIPKASVHVNVDGLTLVTDAQAHPMVPVRRPEAVHG